MTRNIIIWTVITGTIGAIGGLITINYFVVDLVGLIRNGTSIDGSTLPDGLVEPHSLSERLTSEASLTLTKSTVTPTPIPPLDKQLEEALSVSSSSARDKALSIVAQNAVFVRDYWTAITAASASPSSSAQAANLIFVGRCAIEDAKYNLAAEAADKIRTRSARDSLKIEVLEARKRVATGGTSQEISEQQINSQVSCWEAETESNEP